MEKAIRINELSARSFDLRPVCVSPYRPAACGKAALRGLTHERTPIIAGAVKKPLASTGDPHMTLDNQPRRPLSARHRHAYCSLSSLLVSASTYDHTMSWVA
jgi:hypothetical protein